MSTYLATFGNGSRRLFDAASVSQATAYAFAYGRRNNSGALLTVQER